MAGSTATEVLRILAVALKTEERCLPAADYDLRVQRNQAMPKWRAQVVSWLKDVSHTPAALRACGGAPRPTDPRSWRYLVVTVAKGGDIRLGGAGSTAPAGLTWLPAHLRGWRIRRVSSPRRRAPVPCPRLQVSAEFRYDLETLAVAVGFFDRLLSTVPLPATVVQTAALACIHIGETPEPRPSGHACA